MCWKQFMIEIQSSSKTSVTLCHVPRLWHLLVKASMHGVHKRFMKFSPSSPFSPDLWSVLNCTNCIVIIRKWSFFYEWKIYAVLFKCRLFILRNQWLLFGRTVLFRSETCVSFRFIHAQSDTEITCLRTWGREWRAEKRRGYCVLALLVKYNFTCLSLDLACVGASDERVWPTGRTGIPRWSLGWFQ